MQFRYLLHIHNCDLLVKKGALSENHKVSSNITYYILYYIYVAYEYHINIYYTYWGHALAVG